MKLSDRMLRADVFTDGRLLRVSREARMLALVLDSVAESTGVVRRDPDEIRSAAGFFLADAKGAPPGSEQIKEWIEELIAARWALPYQRGSMCLLYLHGFGNRQKGANVCIGVSQTTGEVDSHLPLPPCVKLTAHLEKSNATRKMLPHHCQAAGPCPCEDFTNSSPTLRAPDPKGEESTGEVNAGEPNALEAEAEGMSRKGEPEGEVQAELERLTKEYGAEIAQKAYEVAGEQARKSHRPLDARHLRFAAEAQTELVHLGGEVCEV